MAESGTMAATAKTISSSMVSHFDALENITNYHSTLETGTCRGDQVRAYPCASPESTNNVVLVSLKQVTILQIWLINTRAIA